LPLDPDGTVLITGGTGDLGATVAKHLARSHGVRHLILAGRRGPAAPGASELAAELQALGASAMIVACDLADGDRLSALLEAIPAEHPLTGVFHAAGVLDDGLLGSLTAERVEKTMAPKAQGAWNLHRLTAPLDLPVFVLFSSVMGVLGGPGQANYAAANAFLDALAAHRRAHGLSAASLAWGGWADSRIAERMSEADLARTSRLGIGALSAAEGLELLDAAVARRRTLSVAMRPDLAALGAQADAGLLPPILSLVAGGSRRAPAGVAGSLRKRLASLPAQDREGAALEVVRAEAAIVLGHSSPAAIDPKASFKQLGFDSLGAVELRNRLAQAAGLRLPSTLVFDRPTPTALAAYLCSRLAPEESARQRDGASQADGEDAELRQRIDAMDVQELVRRAMGQPQSTDATVGRAG
jgi:NAD(P)-dependent dehydrogenase (short-subunit alcohol dehydrogenase family)/acyl carrier protein